VPCFLYFGRWYLTATEFRAMIVGSMAAIAIISLIACLIPMGMGLKAIRRLEI
jgi:hypothetical protein